MRRSPLGARRSQGSCSRRPFRAADHFQAHFRAKRGQELAGLAVQDRAHGRRGAGDVEGGVEIVVPASRSRARRAAWRARWPVSGRRLSGRFPSGESWSACTDVFAVPCSASLAAGHGSSKVGIAQPRPRPWHASLDQTSPWAGGSRPTRPGPAAAARIRGSGPAAPCFQRPRRPSVPMRPRTKTKPRPHHTRRSRAAAIPAPHSSRTTGSSRISSRRVSRSWTVATSQRSAFTRTRSRAAAAGRGASAADRDSRAWGRLVERHHDLGVARRAAHLVEVAGGVPDEAPLAGRRRARPRR